MKVFAPGSSRCLCTPSVCSCPRGGEVFVDLGPIEARRRFMYLDYLSLLRSLSDADVYGVVIPDVSGKFRQTYANYLLYSPRLGLYGDAFLVLQEYWNRRYLEYVAEDIGVEFVAVPVWHGVWGPCMHDSTRCAPKISYVLDRLCTRVEKIHLLGPSLGVVKALQDKIEECEKSDTQISTDTYAYMEEQRCTCRRRRKEPAWLDDEEAAAERLRYWLKKIGAIRG